MSRILKRSKPGGRPLMSPRHPMRGPLIKPYKPPAVEERQDDRVRERDGPARGAGRLVPIIANLFDLAGRVGLAAFLTGGFAAGLCLYTRTPAGSPSMIEACVGIFLWCLVLSLCFRSK
jgi:hypothetical protein